MHFSGLGLAFQLKVSVSFCGSAVAVYVLNFCTVASYGVDLVARQQLAVALEWTPLREKQEGEGVGVGEPILVQIYL